jgi:hypothetical protein
MVANVALARVFAAFESGAEAAAQTWTVVGIVQDGLGGGVEVVGGIWVIFVSVAALRAKAVIPRAINVLGLVVGICGVVTIVPALSDFGATFGLLQIVWFAGIGAVLLRADDTQPIVGADV